MFKNYFLIAIRNLTKNPALSFIKISGLTVGVAGCLTIFLLTRYELDFDTAIPDRERIYRIYTEFSGVYSGVNRGVPGILPFTVRDQFTGIEAVTGFHTYSATVTIKTKTGDSKKFDFQDKLVLTDPDYFSVIEGYEWIAGSPKSLAVPFSVVLSEKSAYTYFGTTNPDEVIGKPVIYSDSLEVSVVGLVKSPDHHTDLDFTDFISFETTQKSWLKDNYSLEYWGNVNSSSQCFIKLSPGTDLSRIMDQVPILDKLRKAENTDKNPTTFTLYKLQPFTDLHFNKAIGIFDNSRSPVSLATLKALILIAVLLLSIAAINFINLETARAVRRGKEVGLRKVMGGTRFSLITFFLSENLVLVSIALLFALPLCKLALWGFSEFFPSEIGLNLTDPLLWGFLGATIWVVTLAAGLYPAFVLSSFQPAVALKNQLTNVRTSRSAFLRKVLTVFQFSFSQALIIATLIVSWQIHFLLNKELGFAKDAILQVNTPWWEKKSKVDVLKNELDQLPEIAAISRCGRAPASRGSSSSTFTYNDGQQDFSHTVYILSGDTSYLRLFDLKLIAGRNVVPFDSLNEILVNETYCNTLGIQPVDMVGKTVKGNGRDNRIVGVLQDFHFKSLHHRIEPVNFRYSNTSTGLSLKLAGVSSTASVLEKVKEAWKKVYPDLEITYNFVDETIESFYREEQRTAKLANISTGLAIFISCLGLFGLATFTAIQRTKEIGIRKVLGATLQNIVTLLSAQFLKLVGIAFVVASPLAWYAGNNWLESFAYKTEITGWIFVLAGGFSLLIALLTVSFQAVKAAIVNPVDSLRYE